MLLQTAVTVTVYEFREAPMRIALIPRARLSMIEEKREDDSYRSSSNLGGCRDTISVANSVSGVSSYVWAF